MEEVTEYAIGVDVLGRGTDFSPGEDSIVRNRAYSLRKKLEEFYGGEGADEAIRIELPKGSYVPRFSDWTVRLAPAIAPEALSAAPKKTRGSRRNALATFLGGVALGALGVRLQLSPRLRPFPSSPMRWFWGSLLEDPDKVVICIGTPAQIFLRTLPEGNFAIPGTLPSEPAIREWFAKQAGERNGPQLVQVPTFNSPLWGDAAGASHIVEMLGRYGVGSELVAERVVALPALRNRNVVFLATSEYSPAASRLLKGLPLGIRFDEIERNHIPVRFDAAGKVVERFPVRWSSGALSDVYGLITRLKGDGDGERASRFFVLSGVSSAGILAAAEYVTSPHHLETLEKKVGEANDAPLQVLIRVRADKTLPLSFDYLTHVVGEPK